jgi:hypothetical protein
VRSCLQSSQKQSLHSLHLGISHKDHQLVEPCYLLGMSMDSGMAMKEEDRQLGSERDGENKVSLSWRGFSVVQRPDNRTICAGGL